MLSCARTRPLTHLSVHIIRVQSRASTGDRGARGDAQGDQKEEGRHTPRNKKKNSPLSAKMLRSSTGSSPNTEPPGGCSSSSPSSELLAYVCRMCSMIYSIPLASTRWSWFQPNHTLQQRNCERKQPTPTTDKRKSKASQI